MGLLCLQLQDRHMEEAVLGPSAPSPSGPDNGPLTPLQTALLVSILSWGKVLSLWQGHVAEPQSPFVGGRGSGGDAAKTPGIGQTVGAEAEKWRSWKVASKPAGAEREREGEGES